MIDYKRGYTASFYAVKLDPVTWADMEKIQLIQGTVNRTDTDLRQTASLTVRDFDTTKEQWIRVYMDARQEDNIDHIALFTGLASAPQDDIDGQITTRPLECYSVLEPLQDIKLKRGWWVARGMNGGAAIRRLLRATPAPFEIADGAPLLTDNIIAENSESNLTMVDKILEAMSWQIKIEGNGTIVVGPKQEETEVVFGSRDNDVLQKTLSIKHDWFACPNVFRASSGDLTAIARDDDPDSPLSTVSRGREVQMTEEDVTLADNEGIAQYTTRRLKEEQHTAEEAQYTRRFYPNVNIGSVVRLSYAQLLGDYTVSEQSIALTYAGQTTEKVTKTVRKYATAVTHQDISALIKLPDGYYFKFADGNRVLVPVDIN